LTSQLEECVQKHEAEVIQKKKELDTTLGEINRLKEWKKEKLQDVENNYHIINEKDQEIDHLKMKVKETSEVPCNKGTSSKPPKSKVEEKPIVILQRKN